MVKGYWIGRVDIDDMECYRQYLAQNGVVLSRYGAQFLVRSGPFENPEGTCRGRNVVIEFPSYQAALTCYWSQEYQRLVALRSSAATGDLVIVEGYAGPQP
jgi:uncharacterized protein (DUF1330 family)